MHGHGILQLQTSNQCPEAFHFGTLLAVTVFAASISTTNRGLSYKIYYPSLRTAYAREYSLDKEQTFYNDSLDALRLSLRGYQIE